MVGKSAAFFLLEHILSHPSDSEPLTCDLLSARAVKTGDKVIILHKDSPQMMRRVIASDMLCFMSSRQTVCS